MPGKALRWTRTPGGGVDSPTRVSTGGPTRRSSPLPAGSFCFTTTRCGGAGGGPRPAVAGGSLLLAAAQRGGVGGQPDVPPPLDLVHRSPPRVRPAILQAPPPPPPHRRQVPPGAGPFPLPFTAGISLWRRACS